MSRAWGRGQNFPKPENALKRAEELLRVGQKQAALQTLHNVFTSSGRRYRTWSAVYETIIVRHLDLCCEMRKGRHAKEALQQYRNMCQTTSISSLEDVITHFMTRAQEMADEARVASDAAAIEIDDLDVDATPEDIMLSYVSGDKSKDRTDRTMVTPWFRFLWEAYRNLLDILRHNSRLQTLYALSIRRAFAFCVSYKRTSEFRRLCELLRSHLANIQKRAFYGKDQKDRPDLTMVETLQLYVETRFEQLKAACELELWQEAFRSVEDIINLVVINPGIIQPSMLATYYSHLTQIFAFSDESSLYCAYAWHKLYNLAIKYNKKLTEVDIQMLSTSVLLAALGICPYNRENALQREVRSEAVAERHRRMSNIMRFGLESKTETAEVYSREALLKELSSEAFLSRVPEQVKSLYQLLEHEFNPLGMCKAVDELTEQLSTISCQTSSACPDISVDLSRHAPSLKFVAVLKMLQQLSQVYTNMKTSYLTELVPSMTFGQIESIIVNSVKNRFIKIRIDHKDGTLHFGEDNLDSEKFVTRLSMLAERFSVAHRMMKVSSPDDRDMKVASALSAARDRMEDEHSTALSRKQIIEHRKEEQEQFLLEKEKAEERKRREQTQQTLAAEALRRQQEAERREREREQRELEEREMEEAKAMLERGNKKLKPGQKLDKQKIIEEVLTEQLKEQKEIDRKLQTMSKRLDHLDRAFREEETPLIEKAQEERISEERILHEQDSARNSENHRKAWEYDVAEKQRLLKMKDDKENFAESIRTRRHEELEARRAEREKEVAEMKERRRRELNHLKKKQFIDQTRKSIIETIKSEEEEKQKEIKRQEEEVKRKEREKRQAELDRITEIQKRREEEIEQKKELERRQRLGTGGDAWRRQPSGPTSGGAYTPPSAIRTVSDDRSRSPQRWQPSRNRTPPRTPTKSPGRWRDRPSQNEPNIRAPRSPIGGLPRSSAAYVPPGGRQGHQDNRPPPSSPRFFRDDQSDRRQGFRDSGSRSRYDSGPTERGGSSNYLPPHRRRDQNPPPKEDKGRW